MRIAHVLASALLLLALAVPAVGQERYNTCTLTDQNAVNCSATASGNTRLFVGVANNNTVAQTATVTCYAGSTSGTVIASIAALGATQVIIWPSPGKNVQGALVCQAAGASPSGTGIDIYWR